ncbi:MAG: crossover junction endodeoxyribonuclease RuvC [Bacteroidales bacterium]
MNKNQRLILGIDPGTNILGYGLVLIDNRSAHYVDMGVIKMNKEKDHFSKLNIILHEVGNIIDKYHPDDFAIESPFFGKNPQVMLKLGRAQGAAICAAFLRDVPVYEYAPRKIKMAITGRGQATKEQVALMLSKILDVTMQSKYLDASDALAAAMCHFYQLSNPLSDTDSSTNWKDFIKQHPDRLK